MQAQASSTQEQELSAVVEHKEQLLMRLTELEDHGRSIDEEEERVEARAGELERQIRVLAEEEVDLLERKRELHEQARAIGHCRTRLSTDRSEMDRDRAVLMTMLAKADNSKDQIYRQLAYEESQKSASIVRLEEHDAGPEVDDRRADQRVAVEVEVTMNTEHNFFAGLTENISEGGLFIATREDLPEGTSIDLTLLLPEQEPILAKGRVCWVREYTEFTEDFPPGVGVQFDELMEADREVIERFIRNRAPLLYEIT